MVIATLETLEDFLKSIKTLSFPMAGKALESLVVSVQDILEQKVCSSFEQTFVFLYLHSVPWKVCSSFKQTFGYLCVSIPTLCTLEGL